MAARGNESSSSGGRFIIQACLLSFYDTELGEWWLRPQSCLPVPPPSQEAELFGNFEERVVSKRRGLGVSGCQNKSRALGKRLPPSQGRESYGREAPRCLRVTAEVPFRPCTESSPRRSGPCMHLLKAQPMLQGFAWEWRLQMSDGQALLQGHSSSVPVHCANRSLHHSTWVGALSARMQPEVSLDVWYSGREPTR